MVSKLFSPIKIRGVTIPNRLSLSPLCMYSAIDGIPNDWHFSHLSTYARARVGLIFTEATAVQKIGRITPFCLGLWKDEQIEPFKRITNFIKSMGSVPGFQLAHAGRKASAREPWRGGIPLNDEDKSKGNSPWTPIAPSALPLANGWPTPRSMTQDDIEELKKSYVEASRRAIEAGFEVLEIHAAHGYLINSFLSPISNKRNDEYGGTIENRSKILIDIIKQIRLVIPSNIPLFCRISAVDGLENGWSLDDSVKLAKFLSDSGVDCIDCSSGGILGRPRFAATDDGKKLESNLDRGLGFQVPYADEIKNKANILTMAVGVIVNPSQAENIIQNNQADLVAMGREMMYNPFWSLHAAQELNADTDFQMWPEQYKWGVERRSKITKFKDII